jgi:hypothetical protein
LEGIARLNTSCVESGLKPLSSLRRSSVGEFFGRYAAGFHLLEAVVADCGGSSDGIIRDDGLGLRLRLILGLRAMLAMPMLAWLMLLALIGLAFALMVARIVIALHERLLLHRDEAGLLPEMGEALALVFPVLRAHLVVGTRLRLILAELFLGGGD